MEQDRQSSSSPHNAWRRAYEMVLHEPSNQALFQRIEVAQAAILVRRDALMSLSGTHAEREALAEALAHIRFLKKSRLGFCDLEEDDDY